MAELYLKSDGKHLGHLSEEDLAFLIHHLEEESTSDVDYAIDRLTLEYMKGQGISPSLLQLLEAALGDDDEVEVHYTQT